MTHPTAYTEWIERPLKRILKAAYAHGYGRIHHMDPEHIGTFVKYPISPNCYRPQALPSSDYGFDCPVYMYEPPHGRIKGTCLLFRGTAYIAKEITHAHASCLEIADSLSLRVLSIDYPILPEAAFAESFDRTVRTVQAILRSPLFQAPVVLWGESSGATFCLSAFAVCVEQFKAIPHQMVLFYPIVDNIGEYASSTQYGSGYLLDNSFRAWLYRYYTKEYTKHPWTCPLHLTELKHLQRCHIVASQYDPTRDEAHALFDTLEGYHPGQGRTSLVTYLGLIHGFLFYQRHSTLARMAFLDTLYAIAKW